MPARLLHRPRRQPHAKSGFTLIEVVLDAFVITIVFGAVIGGFLVMLKATDSGKIRTVANALANEQMEYLRNLPYDSLATQNGTILPQGTIPDSQTVTRGGVSLILNTTIIFVDDPFDGCAIPAGAGIYECTDGATSTSQDVVPVDYKRINVEALKVGTPTILVKLSSNAAAKAAETASNTGIILVKVIDAQGLPVAGATATISSDDLDIDITGLTNEQGYLFVANLPPDNHNGYHVTATKSGYSSDFTTSRTSSNPNQNQPDLDVNIQQTTIQTLVIDQLATMAVTVTDQAGAPLGGLALTATSSKTTAFNPTTPKNVYAVNTDGSGIATFTDIEWDSYALTIPNGYYVVTTSPYQSVSVSPGTTLPVLMVITSDSNWPRLDAVSPPSGTVGSTVSVLLDGNNFPGNTTVLLRQAGQSDQLPTSTDVAANGKSITVTFNLTGVATGNWDIVINANGQIITQIGGFIVS